MKSIDELTYKIDKMNKNIVNCIVKAQRESAEEIRNDVKTLAPKKTGKYAESIKVGETEVHRNTIRTPIYTDAKVISSSNKEYNLGYLLETGTSPHLIEPVFAKVLHFEINGEDIFARRVNHPGTIAQPHFKPALNSNKLFYKMKLVEAIKEEFNG